MKKPKEHVALITISEMFNMIEDFADGLTEFMREYGDIDTDEMMQIATDILSLLRERKTEGRAAIIIMLHNAVAMYRIALEQREALNPVRKSKSCPTDLLN